MDVMRLRFKESSRGFKFCLFLTTTLILFYVFSSVKSDSSFESDRFFFGFLQANSYCCIISCGITALSAKAVFSARARDFYKSICDKGLLPLLVLERADVSRFNDPQKFSVMWLSRQNCIKNMTDNLRRSVSNFNSAYIDGLEISPRTTNPKRGIQIVVLVTRRKRFDLDPEDSDLEHQHFKDQIRKRIDLANIHKLTEAPDLVPKEYTNFSPIHWSMRLLYGIEGISFQLQYSYIYDAVDRSPNKEKVYYKESVLPL